MVIRHIPATAWLGGILISGRVIIWDGGRTMKQLSVFLENRTGRLEDVVTVLTTE